MKRIREWQCGRFRFDTSQPIVMGILNQTPDSFSDGGCFNSLEIGLEHAQRMLDEGAVIIDVGGESTRPGSDEVSIEEESARVLPIVRALAEKGIAVSIDTRHAAVARACVEAGAVIINDVAGFRDEDMRAVAASCDVGLVVMHMAGEPKTMQDDPIYENVVLEVRDYLLAQAAKLEALGVEPERICLDPGFGFGKNAEHNWEMLAGYDVFAEDGYPYMVAASRKNFTGVYYGGEKPRDRIWASVAVAVRAVEQGAFIARVHDVAQTIEAFAYLRLPASRAYIAIGSNTGDRLAELQKAADEIADLPATRLIAASTVYESEPAYFDDQATFANAVLEIETRLHPQVLLVELQRLERAAGRVRTFKNAPRILDLDILDYAGTVWNDDLLVLPHPLALERDFVVTPLLELDSECELADGTAVTRDGIRYGAIIGTFGMLDLQGS
jgi:dihydropteroate synthase